MSHYLGSNDVQTSFVFMVSCLQIPKADRQEMLCHQGRLYCFRIQILDEKAIVHVCKLVGPPTFSSQPTTLHNFVRLPECAEYK